MQRDAYERLFELYSEAVAVLRNEKIFYMNVAFRRMFPAARVNGAANRILPEFICEFESERFTTSARFGEVNHIVSVTTMGCDHIVSIYPTDGDKMLTNWENFLESLSSELRSTVSIVRFAADTMNNKHKMDDEMQEKYSAMLMHEAYCAIRLANSIDMLRNISTGNVRKSEDCFDIAELCAELVESTNWILDRGDFKITFSSFAPSVNFVGDKDKIEQLLLNLLSNSIKYTNTEGAISVVLSERKDAVMLSVSDNGKGIESENLMSSFESYTKKRSISDGKAGMGMGLALVDYVAKLHNGHAFLESVKGKGTRVTVILRSAEKETLSDIRVEYRDSRRDNLYTILSDVLDYTAYLPKNMD